MNEQKEVWKINMFKADPHEAYMEMQTLDEITPKNVVELARSTDSVLHDDFEWDDAIAGPKWREEQARIMIRNLAITIEQKEAWEPDKVRILHITKETGVYKPIEHFVKHEDEYEGLLLKAKKELEAFKEKYSILKELREIFDMINNL